MIKRTFQCPLCKSKANLVSYITVKHLVNNKLQHKVLKKPYYICMNEHCHIVYFSLECHSTFYETDLQVPIWFKKDANPKYICYCNKVTEEMILSAIRDEGATDLKQICEITGAMSNCNCLNNNPLGKCCGKLIKKIIESNTGN